MQSKEELMVKMEKVLSVSEKQNKCHTGKICYSIWKNCHLFQKSAIDDMNISEKCRKVPSKEEKIPSQEEMMLNMKKMLYVSEKCPSR